MTSEAKIWPLDKKQELEIKGKIEQSPDFKLNEQDRQAFNVRLIISEWLEKEPYKILPLYEKLVSDLQAIPNLPPEANKFIETLQSAKDEAEAAFYHWKYDDPTERARTITDQAGGKLTVMLDDNGDFDRRIEEIGDGVAYAVYVDAFVEPNIAVAVYFDLEDAENAATYLGKNRELSHQDKPMSAINLLRACDRLTWELARKIRGMNALDYLNKFY